jgi:hypothetical protein
MSAGAPNLDKRLIQLDSGHLAKPVPKASLVASGR